MGRFLDQRSSENASSTGAINVALTATPTLFGVIGLQTQGVANPIVNLSGTISTSSPTAGQTYLLQVVRGTAITDPVIYTAILSQAFTGAQLRSFNVQDLNAPAAAQTAYASFISSVTPGASRVGPEVFWGTSSQG